MNKKVVIGTILILIGVATCMIAIFNLSNDAFWLGALITAIITSYTGVQLIEN